MAPVVGGSGHGPMFPFRYDRSVGSKGPVASLVRLQGRHEQVRPFQAGPKFQPPKSMGIHVCDALEICPVHL